MVVELGPSLAESVLGLLGGKASLPSEPAMLGRVADVDRQVRVDDVDQVLGSRLTSDVVRMTVRGRALPSDAYCSFDDQLPTGGEAKFVDRDKVLDLLRRGATAVLGRPDYLFSCIESACGMLEDLFRYQWKSSMFITGPSTVGLQPHYDGESVMAIQVAGSKTWKVGVEPIVDGATSGSAVPDPGQTASFSLYPGDVLWIPRGYVHVAAAQSEGSIHFTLFSVPFTPYDLILKALDIIRVSSPGLRRQLTNDYWRDTTSAREWVSLAGRLLQEMSDAEIEHITSELCIERYWTSRRGRSGSLGDALIGARETSMRGLSAKDARAAAAISGLPDRVDLFVSAERDGLAHLIAAERDGFGTAHSRY